MPLILKKENPGYVLNAMLGPLLAMTKILVIKDLAPIYEVLISALIENAILIAHNQVADPAQIDRAWTASLSLRKVGLWITPASC